MSRRLKQAAVLVVVFAAVQLVRPECANTKRTCTTSWHSSASRWRACRATTATTPPAI